MRCWVHMLILGGVLQAGQPALGQEKKQFQFSKEAAGKVPDGWKVTQTNKGKGSEWKVVADPTAPSKTGFVLAQIAESPTAVFNLCIAEKTRFQDVEIRADFKAVKGDIDQGGGLVWRFKDAKNYYIARVNPLEDNFRVYKVVNGKRIQLDSVKVKVPAGKWHHIKIKQIGDKIECFLDGKKMMTVNDDTFTETGAVGLWTKADAQTYFDNIVVQAPKRQD